MTKRQRAKGQGEAVAVGYVRVSTEGQAAEGVSLDAQKARLEAWAATVGRRLVGVYVDAGVSGKRADNRPGLQAALRDACQRGAPLVVYSLSRLARSVRDTLEITARLEKCGADLVSLSEQLDTTSAAGRMVYRMLAVLAEFERDLASERTAGALAHKRARGERISRHAPFGFQFDGGRVVPDARERATLAKIRRLSEQGVAQRAIVERLNAEGVPARGTRWHLRGVQLALAATA